MRSFLLSSLYVAVTSLLLLSFLTIAPCLLVITSHALNNPLPKSRQMVCCAYNEDLIWLHRAARHYDKIFLYIKNQERFLGLKEEFKDERNIEVISFENKGSCDHIYLHHIMTHYDDLADQMAFMKGSCAPYIRKYYYFYLPLGRYQLFYDYYLNTEQWALDKKKLMEFSLDDYAFEFHSNVHAPFQKTPYKNLEEFLRARFTKSEVDNLVRYASHMVYKGNFIVSQHNIKRYPKEVYAKLFDNETPGPNREVDHFQERIWGLLFSNTLEDPFSLS